MTDRTTPLGALCLHGVWDYGKSLTATDCFDFRRCRVCGATEYKQQWANWRDDA